MVLTKPVPPRVIVVSPAHRAHIAQASVRTIVSPSSSAVDDELAQARTAWNEYQSTRRRNAIYDYLRAVFKIVCRWRKQHRAKASSHQALKAAGRVRRIRNVEPLGVVILCTSDPRKVDAKTRSKWSRALRYAEQFKPDAESLAEFVKSHGGINECADRWAESVE
jgi:DNA-binding PucR family transcriptional regulator